MRTVRAARSVKEGLQESEEIVGVSVACMLEDIQQNHVNLEIQSVAAK